MRHDRITRIRLVKEVTSASRRIGCRIGHVRGPVTRAERVSGDAAGAGARGEFRRRVGEERTVPRVVTHRHGTYAYASRPRGGRSRESGLDQCSSRRFSARPASGVPQAGDWVTGTRQQSTLALVPHGVPPAHANTRPPAERTRRESLIPEWSGTVAPRTRSI